MLSLGVFLLLCTTSHVHGAAIQILDEWHGRVHASVNENPTTDVNGWEIILTSNIPLGKIDVRLHLSSKTLTNALILKNLNVHLLTTVVVIRRTKAVANIMLNTAYHCLVH